MMSLRIKLLTALCAIAVCGPPAVAVTTILECVEADGSVSFSDVCPPGSVKTGERRYSSSIGIGQDQMPYGAESPEITLYSVANCDACDLVRNVLNTRNVPYNEKNVAENVEHQDELRDAAGALNVPTVLIGENILSGYNRSAIEAALNQAGFELAAQP